MQVKKLGTWKQSNCVNYHLTISQLLLRSVCFTLDHIYLLPKVTMLELNRIIIRKKGYFSKLFNVTVYLKFDFN